MQITTHTTEVLPSHDVAYMAATLAAGANDVLTAADHTATAAHSGRARRYTVRNSPAQRAQIRVGKGRLVLRGLGSERGSRPKPVGANGGCPTAAVA